MMKKYKIIDSMFSDIPFYNSLPIAGQRIISIFALILMSPIILIIIKTALNRSAGYKNKNRGVTGHINGAGKQP